MARNKVLSQCYEHDVSELKSKYGTVMTNLNGLSDDHLNYGKFIENFIDNQVVADATIDQSANIDMKDITSLMTEGSKAHFKELSLNKIHFEMIKKYGRQTAKEWLEGEWNGEYYLHNAHSSSFMPYCYYGKENLYVKYKEEGFYINFEDLYGLIEEEEVLLDKIEHVKCKYSDELFVRDFVEGNIVWTKVIRVMYRPKNLNKKMVQIKTSNGLSQIVTEDHPVITMKGDKKAIDVINDDILTTFNLKISESNKINLDNDYAWLLGMILAEGWYCNKYTIGIRQSKKYNPEVFNKITKTLQKHNISYGIYKDESLININSINAVSEIVKHIDIIGNKSNNKQLYPDFIKYSNETLLGIISGIIDGDGNIGGYKNRRAFIRMTSRTLLNQISVILQNNNVIVRDRVPYFHSHEKSFKSNLTMFGIEFNLSEINNVKNSLNSVKIHNLYIEKIRKGNFKNKQYSDNYGENKVIACSVIESLQDEEFVYDISTETGHFIQNNILSHNCYAYSLEELAKNGLFFLGRFKSEAPKHLDTFNSHVLEFLSYVTNRTSGACGLADLLIWHMYYYLKDKKEGYLGITDWEKYKKQHFQSFIYNLNQPYLRINQSSFTNVSIFDREYFMAMFGGKTFPDGTLIMDYMEEFMQYQKDFMEIVSDIRGKSLFTYPVLTFCLLYDDKKSEFVDNDMARWANKHNMKWYDSNFYIGTDITSLSSCCRLINNFDDLNKKKDSLGFINSIGGTSLSIGSVQVNTINLNRIALEAKSINPTNYKDIFMDILSKRVDISMKVLDVIRGIIKRNVDKGLLPIYKQKIIQMENQYNTIGIAAMYNALDTLGLTETDAFGNKQYTLEGEAFAVEILNHINSLKNTFAETKDYLINIESVPAERAAAILCKKDKLLFGQRNVKSNIYANQWIALTDKCTTTTKIKTSAMLDKLVGGGNILHVNIENSFVDEEQSWAMLNKIAKAGVIYFAYNIKISACEDNHGFIGSVCHCGKPAVETYSRIVGFLVPYSSFSKERKEEFNDRIWNVLND